MKNLKKLYDWYFLEADMAAIVPPSYEKWVKNPTWVSMAEKSAQQQGYKYD